MTESRSKFRHALALAKYNRTLYLGAALATGLGVILASLTAMPLPLRVAGALGAGVAAWYAAASFLAFHLMFDRSPLLSGAWLRNCVEASPARCVQLCVGLGETTLPLQDLFPSATCLFFDLFNPEAMTEPALNRARGEEKEPAAKRVPFDNLPCDPAANDLVVVMLAAHELRDPKAREKLFAELRRITLRAGTLVVVEHLRNTAAFLAFGPAFVHFYPRREWLRLAQASGLSVRKEFDITPFVHVFVLSPEEPR